MSRIVVTGGAGFIGSHLVDRLIGDGDEVVVVDNLSTGRSANLLEHQGRIVLHAVDVADPAASLADYFAGADTIYHLAALADIVPSINHPADYFRANVDGTFNVVEAARSAGVRRVVYAASSSCYGIPDEFPTPETAPMRPQYPYALTKRLGEEIMLHWAQVYGLSAVSMRFFNVFGTRARTTGTYGAVMGVFLAQKLAGRPFTVVGDGEQTRDFTYVTDIVDGLVTAARSNVSGESINLGSGGTYSINDLVALLGGEVCHLPKRPGEPDCTLADISKARRLLDWQPTIAFNDGVALMLDHIDDWRNAPVWEAAAIAHETAMWFSHLGRDEASRAAAATHEGSLT